MNFDKIHKNVKRTHIGSWLLIICVFVVCGALFAVSNTDVGVGVKFFVSLIGVLAFLLGSLLVVVNFLRHHREPEPMTRSERDAQILAGLDWDPKMV